ncbi:MAG TPA: ABC transporter permease, partial [Chryseolinea sp.]|nr:ABC transporter permease [Chryseolinea sp.]
MLTHYLKSAWRNLVRKRTYSFINIAGLALGLASTWLIALYIIDELSYDRFNEKSERIFRVVQHSQWNNNEVHLAITSGPFAPAIKAAFPEIEDAVRIDREGGGVITFGDKKINQGDVFFADKSLLNVFSYSFLSGNHTALDNPESVIITETLAKKLFGAPEKAFKQVIYFDTQYPATITGIIKDIPGNSHLRFSAVRAASDDHFGDNWQNSGIYTYLLLKEGANINRLREKLAVFANTTIKKQVKVDNYSVELQPVTSIHLHSNLGFELSPNGNIARVYIFIAIGLLILIIAIINYTNLTTARASARIKEIGVRKAIGSGKSNLAGIFITEALLVTFIAACIAIVIVNFSLPFFNRLTEKDLSLDQPGVLTTTATLLAFSVLTGFISGIYPSVFLARFKTIPALKGQMGNLS